MDKLSISLYSRGSRCNADCGFCAWNKGFKPVAGENRERLSVEALLANLAYAQAQDQPTALELMDSSLALNAVSLQHYLELAAHLPPGFGINPGICQQSAWLEQLVAAGAGYYVNNLETSSRLFRKFVGTHTQAAKLRSLQLGRQVGLKIHTGFIIGLEETDADWDEMFQLVDKLQPDGVNINFFYPARGLQLAEGFNFPEAEVALHRVEEFCHRFSGTTIYLGAGRRRWLRHCLAEAEVMVTGVYVKRFLNHEALPLAVQ